MVADYYHDYDMIMLVILIMIKTMRMMMMMIIFIIMKKMRMMKCFVCSKMVVDSVSLNSWLHMWARMCQGAAGIDDFPIWVQLIPRSKDKIKFKIKITDDQIWVQLIPRSSNTFMIDGGNILR